ncbi:SUKH-4 family immunity protein [Streptomyces sp. ISL-22]|uniref:SUKH-4 family immunity protein n=1 Tax=unclassified Streptomyces TaxID=2593676 RepID=UPI001BECFD11|nr:MULTISPECIES: SUKH-4 family immunity protein [unclassified Streptomyces]MBT2419692.1 SUKH-4 family immunity protein [Streptomyces sp. ISL-24]MBT2436457.1 SUKH-4 family immunity protein [Streptomyces sp. ISL-22]
MSTTMTTYAGDTAIILTEAELGPYVTHASTRRWLTGPGLPGDSGVLSFAELCREGLRTVADSTGDPDGRLAAELRDQLVIGGLLGPGGLETESVLLDGATGEVSTTHFLHDRPDLMDRRPLAPSLRTLVRFAEATDELAGLRGQFASYVGRYGPQAVAEASRHLLAVFEEGTDGEPAPLWKMAALIRPLTLVAGRAGASGLALDLPPRLLDQEFGQGKVARFEDVDFPATLTHEPTRRFLREVGLPEDGYLFSLDIDVPLQTLAEYYADEDLTTELPSRADHLIRLGPLVEDNSLLVDGETGAVLNWSEPEARLFPLNTDVSTLAFTLWLLHREQAIDEESGHELTTGTYDQLAMTMLQVLSTVDPTGTRAGRNGRHYWTEAFQDEASGVLESVGGVR